MTKISPMTKEIIYTDEMHLKLGVMIDDYKDELMIDKKGTVFISEETYEYFNKRREETLKEISKLEIEKDFDIY